MMMFMHRTIDRNVWEQQFCSIVQTAHQQRNARPTREKAIPKKTGLNPSFIYGNECYAMATYGVRCIVHFNSRFPVPLLDRAIFAGFDLLRVPRPSGFWGRWALSVFRILVSTFRYFFSFFHFSFYRQPASYLFCPCVWLVIPQIHRTL